MTSLAVRLRALAMVLLAACASQQPPDDAEIAALQPLKRQYVGLIAGFDVRPHNTLIVSVDLQQYIESDDNTIAAMKRDTLRRWREAWIAEHPRAHAVLRVRFIDFIGRKVATETTRA